MQNVILNDSQPRYRGKVGGIVNRGPYGIHFSLLYSGVPHKHPRLDNWVVHPDTNYPEPAAVYYLTTTQLTVPTVFQG